MSGLEADLKVLISDSLSLKSNFKRDTLFLTIAGMPDLRTNDSYNQLFMAYLYYKSFPVIKKENISNVSISVSHSYHNLSYNFIYNKSNTKGILSDFENADYLSIVEFLLSNIGDDHSAYYKLTMAEAKTLFPDAEMNEDLYSLLCKYPFKNVESIYSHDESMRLELELMLFYWVCQYPYGNLSFDRGTLKTALDILQIADLNSWDKKKLDLKYKAYLSKKN